MFGRNGESPVPVIAPKSPSDCFDAALEACRIAIEYRTPVFLLSDGTLQMAPNRGLFLTLQPSR
jgi:2-oxoglutarate ferredoxin oxidoreductase subunit alpha